MTPPRPQWPSVRPRLHQLDDRVVPAGSGLAVTLFDSPTIAAPGPSAGR